MDSGRFLDYIPLCCRFDKNILECSHTDMYQCKVLCFSSILFEALSYSSLLFEVYVVLTLVNVLLFGSSAVVLVT